MYRVEVFAEQLHGVPRRLHFQVQPVVSGKFSLLHPLLKHGQIVKCRAQS